MHKVYLNVQQGWSLIEVIVSGAILSSVVIWILSGTLSLYGAQSNKIQERQIVNVLSGLAGYVDVLRSPKDLQSVINADITTKQSFCSKTQKDCRTKNCSYRELYKHFLNIALCPLTKLDDLKLKMYCRKYLSTPLSNEYSQCNIASPMWFGIEATWTTSKGEEVTSSFVSSI